MAKGWKRWRELGWNERAMLAEAAVTLAAASFAIAMRPFRKVVAIAARAPARDCADPARRRATIARVVWAVEAMGRRLPWRIVCFQKGLAVHLMLRRRGVGTILHYGVAQSAAKGLTAHVWITDDGVPIIGGEEAGTHTCLATFPSAVGA